jgi:hypothetical protein
MFFDSGDKTSSYADLFAAHFIKSLYRTPGVWPGTATGLRVAVAFSNVKES